MVGNKIYDERNREVTFDPPIFDHVARKLYLSRESYSDPLPVRGEVYSFIKAYADNYAHWICDVLPCFRLFDYNQKKIHINNSKKFQVEFLSLLGVREEDVIPYPKIQGVRPEVLNFVYSGSRYEIEGFYDEFPAKFGIIGGKGKKIYVSRRKSKFRKVLNEERTFELLSSRGFEMYFLEELSVVEQIRLFNSADFVVMPHGAGAANLFFCRKGTKVVQFWPGRLFESYKIYPKKLNYTNLYESTYERDCMVVNVNRLSHVLDGTF